MITNMFAVWLAWWLPTIECMTYSKLFYCFCLREKAALHFQYMLMIPSMKDCEHIPYRPLYTTMCCTDLVCTCMGPCSLTENISKCILPVNITARAVPNLLLWNVYTMCVWTLSWPHPPCTCPADLRLYLLIQTWNCGPTSWGWSIKHWCHHPPRDIPWLRDCCGRLGV